MLPKSRELVLAAVRAGVGGAPLVNLTDAESQAPLKSLNSASGRMLGACWLWTELFFPLKQGQQAVWIMVRLVHMHRAGVNTSSNHYRQLG